LNGISLRPPWYFCIINPGIAFGPTPPGAGGNHFTNGPEEKADLWHMHLMQDQAYGFADDDYIDWAGGQKYDTRHYKI